MKVWDFKDKHSNWIKVSTNDPNVFRVQVYRCDVVVGLVSNLKNKHQHLISTLHWNRNNNVVVFNIKLIILYVTVKNSLLSKFKYVNQRWKKKQNSWLRRWFSCNGTPCMKTSSKCADSRVHYSTSTHPKKSMISLLSESCQQSVTVTGNVPFNLIVKINPYICI